MSLPELRYCPGTLAEGFESYSRTCLNRVFYGKKVQHVLQYDSPSNKEVAVFFEENRKQQAVVRMHSTILDYLNSSFYNLDDVKMLLPEMERQLHDGAITSYNAALKLLEKYFKRCH